MANLPRLRRLLLGMLGPEPELAALRGLGSDDWAALGTMAAEHRLEPLLHHLCRVEDRVDLLPKKIAGRWDSAYRASTMAALLQRAELFATVQILENAGIACVALKGPWLAWHAYPAPVLRPMRDIDLLVEKGQVEDAWSALLEAGYRSDERTNAKPFDDRKHLPCLLSPQGVTVELHSRCWETAEEAGFAMPEPIDTAILAGAATTDDDPVQYPSPAHMLTTLCVHAACSHRLDAGALVLCDVDYLLQHEPIAWDDYWKEASSGGWAASAALVLALVDRWRRPHTLTESNCPIAVPASILDAAPDLLFQPMANRSSTQFLAGLAGPGPSFVAKLSKHRPEGAFSWFADRAMRTLRDLADPARRQRARQSAALARWLENTS